MLLVVGESLVDVIRSGESGAASAVHPGGSPLNVAVGASRLGVPTTLVTAIGDDADGRVICDHLASNGVETIVAPLPTTSRAVATLDDDGAASYTFAIDWDIRRVVASARDVAQGATHIHVGSISTILEPGASDVFELLIEAQSTASISFDPNCRPAIDGDAIAAAARAEQFVAVSDVVKASDEDLTWLYPDRDPEASARAWLEFGPAFVVVTRGAAGPIVFCRHGTVEVPAIPVDVADTVGAGDSFMAALIARLWAEGRLGVDGLLALSLIDPRVLQEIIAWASLAASITCSRPGADPPWASELADQDELRTVLPLL